MGVFSISVTPGGQRSTPSDSENEGGGEGSPFRIYCASASNIDSAVAGTAYVVSVEDFMDNTHLLLQSLFLSLAIK